MWRVYETAMTHECAIALLVYKAQRIQVLPQNPDSSVCSTTRMCRGTLMNVQREEIVEWSCYFVFFVYKKYSRSFITLRLNLWCHIDYFNNVLTTFWALNVLVALLSMQGQKAHAFHQNILIWVLKMNEGLTGWHDDDWIFIFGWTMPLRPIHTKNDN